MESIVSPTGTQQPNLPPGFRFHPTDEELVVHYLKRKATSAPLPVAIIADVDLYKFDPWELPAKASFGEQEWYFFSHRDRKYPNGARPNRAATSGYWKATGNDKPVLTSGGTQKIGVKKALVFYGGKPPKGTKTDWIMHEYRLAENKATNKPPGYNIDNKTNSLRLDGWVLCRIYKKNNITRPTDHGKNDSVDNMFSHVPPPFKIRNPILRFPFNGMLDNDHTTILQGRMLSNEGRISQLALASSKAALALPMGTTNISTTNILPLTRNLPSQCWNDDHITCQSPTKKFHADINNVHATTTDGNDGSIANMLNNQLPHNLSMQQAMMESLEYDQVPGMNWFS